MRRWGVIISGFYAGIIFGLLMPGWLVLFNLPLGKGEGFGWWNVYTEDLLVFVLTWGLLLVGGQALLLFLSVDTSWRRLKPRRHIAIIAALTGLLITLLAVAGIVSLAMAFHGDSLSSEWAGVAVEVWILIIWVTSWIAWGIVTGLAIMFMCFGPGVLALYKKRIDAYGAGTVEDASA